MKRPWMLAELTYSEVKENPPEVVVLPFGATEPHNLHLPYGTDNIEAESQLAGAVVKVSAPDHVSLLPGTMVALRRRFQRRVKWPRWGSDGSSRLKPLLRRSLHAAINSGASISSTSMR